MSDRKAPKIFSVVNLSMESPQADSIILSPEMAVSTIHQLFEDGADYVDIGGRSSGSKTSMISGELERSRLQPVFELVAEQKVSRLSIDSWSATTCLAFLDQVDVINYTSTDFPDVLLDALADSNVKLVLSYLSAKNPYALRQAPCLPFEINRVIDFFDKTLSRLAQRQVQVLAIDPNLGMWHPLVPDQEKPKIQETVIEHIPILKKLAPIFIVAPRLAGTLNVPLTSFILEQSVDFIRTHDLKALLALLQLSNFDRIS